MLYCVILDTNTHLQNHPRIPVEQGCPFVQMLMLLYLLVKVIFCAPENIDCFSFVRGAMLYIEYLWSNDLQHSLWRCHTWFNALMLIHLSDLGVVLIGFETDLMHLDSGVSTTKYCEIGLRILVFWLEWGIIVSLWHIFSKSVHIIID